MSVGNGNVFVAVDGFIVRRGTYLATRLLAPKIDRGRAGVSGS
jgi:hypothetical protein